jgi:hypothetical protein
MYLRTTFSFNPTVLTQCPRAHKRSPGIHRLINISQWMHTATFSLQKPYRKRDVQLRETLRHRWIWSGSRCSSSSCTLFRRHSYRIIFPTFLHIPPYSLFFAEFATFTAWYLHCRLMCDKPHGVQSLGWPKTHATHPCPTPALTDTQTYRSGLISHKATPAITGRRPLPNSHIRPPDLAGHASYFNSSNKRVTSLPAHVELCQWRL